MMEQGSRSRAGRSPRARVSALVTAVLGLARVPARPLRASGRRRVDVGRALLAMVLTLALVGPLAVTGPFSALAQEEPEADEGSAVQDAEAGVPFWQVLRQNDEDDEGDEVVRPWTDKDLNAVHFPTEEVGYAVGADGTVLRTEDRGESWEVSRLRRDDQIGNLHDVHFISESTGVAVGQGKNDEGKTTGVIVLTHNGGERWVQVPSEVDVALRGVHFPTPQVGYAVGDPSPVTGCPKDPCFTILKSSDGGRSWTRLPNAPNVTAKPLFAVHFIDASTGVAVGHITTPQTPNGTPQILRTEDGGESWDNSSTSVTPRPRDVVVLDDGVGYAVGNHTTGSAVTRTTDGFSDGSLSDEPAPFNLRGVAAYRAMEQHPVVVALEALASVLADGPPQEVRDPLGDGLDAVAEEIEELEPVDDGGAVDQALQDLAGDLEALADRIRDNEDWETVALELESLGDPIELLLGATQAEREAVAEVLHDTAKTIQDVEVPEPADHEDVEGGQKDLADGLRGLAAAIQDPEGDEVDHGLEETRVRVEVAHAVGFVQSALPVALTRSGEAHVDAEEVPDDEENAPDSDSPRPWVAEPIEDWDQHAGAELRAVSASPGGETVVAVGSGGLMLRRAVGPEEVVESMCVPRTELEPVDESLVGIVCPQEEEDPDDPEDRETELVSPPSITATPDAVRPGGAITVSGEHWLACGEPDADGERECEASRVTVKLRQGGRVFGLGQVTAGGDGRFSLGVTVPEQAEQGDAVLRAEGTPEPNGGPEAEVGITVMQATPVSVTVTPGKGRPGDAITVRGAGWEVCESLDDCDGVRVGVAFVQGEDTFELAEVDAEDDGTFTLAVTVPEEVEAGDAVVRASGEPRPDGGASAQAPFDVLTECEITVAATNPDFPCLKRFHFKDEIGNDVVVSTRPFLDFDPGLGESGRLVAVQDGLAFLYDLDRLEQTEVIDLVDACQGIEGEACAGAVDDSTQVRHVALDTENHRLYLTDGGSQRTITAVSLTGEFPATQYILSGAPTEQITHLAVDGSNNMLYAVTTSSLGSITQQFATRAPQRDVYVRAIPVDVLDGGTERRLVLGPDADVEPGDEVEPSWSLYVGDLCSTTALAATGFLGVSSDGRRLSLSCQGTDFFFVGFPQVNANGILAVTLPEGESPRELTQQDATTSGRITRDFAVVSGGGMGLGGVFRVQGDRAAGLLTWRSGDLFLVWDVDKAGWVAGATLEGRGNGNFGASLLGADPVGRRLYLNQSAKMPDGHVGTMEVLNLPGKIEKVGDEALDTGLGPDLRANVTTIERGAFDPETRRLVISAGSGQNDRFVAVLEDRTPRPLSGVELHPDRHTNDIDEELASSVDRRGETAAYGARVWWTGLAGSLPGTYCVKAGPGLVPNLPYCEEPPPGLTYDDLMEKGSNFGANLGRVPWQPYRGQREVYSARVEEGILESSDSALGFSSGLSEGIAWGLDTDGRKEDTGGTGEDVRSRRSTRDWHGRDDAAEFDRCFEELYDRLLREADGDRRIDHGCFSDFDEGAEQFDEESPDQFPATHEDGRPGAEEHLGLTQRSHCVDRGGEAGDESTRGSAVACDVVGQSTVAAADNALPPMELPGGVRLEIEGSFSGTKVFRDGDRGIVSQAVGVASGVDLVIAEVGRLQIGEVLTRAETQATGRPGGARSDYTVAYKDVRVTAEAGPDGEPGDVVVFSCDPAEDEAIVAGDTVAGAAGELTGAADALAEAGEKASDQDLPRPGGAVPDATCDPESLSDALASVFGPRVTIRVPERDLDEIADGTPGGAQAIVRRHRTDYYNDDVLFRVKREEVPGLQIEVNADGTLANRFRVDLAAVYAESGYFIGEPTVPLTAPPMVEAPMVDRREAATVHVELVDPTGEPLEGGVFKLALDGGVTVGCTTDEAGRCTMTPLPLGAYALSQPAAPPGYLPAAPMAFELSQPGQVAQITVVNGREGTAAGSEVIEIVEIIDDARPAAAMTQGDEQGGWWRRAAQGLAQVILRNPWTAVALALVGFLLAAPGYLAARRRELSMMRELT